VIIGIEVPVIMANIAASLRRGVDMELLNIVLDGFIEVAIGLDIAIAAAISADGEDIALAMALAIAAADMASDIDAAGITESRIAMTGSEAMGEPEAMILGCLSECKNVGRIK
jgi:hypothetical protein